MDKDDFLDVLFAGAWISIIITFVVALLIAIVSKVLKLSTFVPIVAVAITSPIITYNVCKYLYYRKYGK